MPFHNLLTEKYPIQFYILLTEKYPIQFYIYLYRLSFNWQDKEALMYLRKAFYPIHELLSQDKLEYISGIE